MNSSEKCQKWIKYNKKSTLYSVLILLILLSNESQHSVNCQNVVSEGLKAVETTIPQLLQNAGDLTTSETVSLPGLPGMPGLDSVRAFFVRNQNWMTPVIATIPAKMATFMTLRALRQQAVTQEQQQQTDGMIGGLRGIAGDCGADCMFMSGGNPGSGRANNRLRGNRGLSNNIQTQGGDGGNFGGDGGGCGGGCCGGGCDDDNKKTMMVFVGDGNIQVKNHGNDNDEEGSDQKYYTYQEIDEGKQWANLNKEMPSLFDRLIPLRSRGTREINVIQKRRPKRMKKTRTTKDRKGTQNNRTVRKTK